MSGPYVAFRVNISTRAILTNTIRYDGTPMPELLNPLEWVVVCDSGDRVVIRALAQGRRELVVIAVASLRGQKLVDKRQVDANAPTAALWSWLEVVVFATRERAHELHMPDRYDNEPLPVPAAEPDAPSQGGGTPEQVWQMAQGQIAAAAARIPVPQAPSQVPQPRKKPDTRPPPAAPPPDQPLWGPVGTDKPGAARQRYLEFLFDHADVMVVAGCVRYAPDSAMRPKGAYQQKLICDGAGAVQIRAEAGDLLDDPIIATALWKDSALVDRKQGSNVPDDFQWIALEDALRAELGRAP